MPFFIYTAANDVSARDWQIRQGGTQWSRGKTFDTFCPLGPVLVTADEVPDPNGLEIRTLLNGHPVQGLDDRRHDLRRPHAHRIPQRVHHAGPGTVILTGTPHGVGMARNPQRWLRAGDVVTIEIERIGSLTNPVVEED